MFILPCLSTSHSTAPEKKNLVKARASFLVNGSFFNFSSSNFHSSIGYANKHLSSPRVTTKLSPRSSRNLAGTIIRPFVSILCWCSPMNIEYAPLSYTPCYHIPPQFTTYFLKFFPLILKIGLMRYTSLNISLHLQLLILRTNTAITPVWNICHKKSPTFLPLILKKWRKVGRLKSLYNKVYHAINKPYGAGPGMNMTGL